MDSACWGAVRTVVAVEQLLDCKDRRASRCWTEPRLTVADFLYFAATAPAVSLLQPISVTRMDKKGAEGLECSNDTALTIDKSTKHLHPFRAAGTFVESLSTSDS